MSCHCCKDTFNSLPYTPKCCPPSSNTDPRRNIPYVPPKPSRSEPMSHAEYLRRLKSGNRGANSLIVKDNQQNPVQTIWTELVNTTDNVKYCCNNPLERPSVPAVHPGGTAVDAGLTTMMEGSAAARGTLSHYDTTNHTEWNTTYRRQGLAIIKDTTYKAPAGERNEECSNCTLEGTSTSVVPGNPDKICDA